MAKSKLQINSRPSVGIACYVILSYWVVVLVVHFTIDLLIDLYTDQDYLNVFWYTAAIALPFAAYTMYVVRQSLFTSWYTYLLFPLLIYGLYLGSAYFTALKLDLLMSAAVKPEKEHILPVKTVRQVFAGRAGFVHTDITLAYQHRLITFEGTRTSYFLLKPYKSLQVKIGHSCLGSYYVTHINIPAQERWAARRDYLKNWFDRYYWLLIAFAIFSAFGWFKDQYFPASVAIANTPEKAYYKLLKRVLIVLMILFGLFMMVLLVIGLGA